MKKLIVVLILLLAGQVNAVGYGSSIEGDSAGVTLTLNTARDSAWIRFASPNDNFYDSVKAVPISGSSNKILIAPYLDLDTLGGHIVVAYTFTGGIRVDTIAGAWYHRAAHVGVNWADIINPASSQPTINVQLWKGVTPADLESDFTVQAHVTDMSDNVIGSGELQDDITIPKMTFGGLFMDSMWIINDNGEAVKIATTTGTDHAIGIDAMGRGIDINAVGSGIYIVSTAGSGIYALSGVTHGVEFVSNANNKAGLHLQGIGSGGIGLLLDGFTDATDVSGHWDDLVDDIYDEDTTGHGTAQSFAVLSKDTSAYQGSASGLTAAGIWQYHIRDDTTDGAVDDTSAADHLYSASSSGGGASAADVWNYDISGFTAGQYQYGIGIHGISQSPPTIPMKLGNYSGAAGDNIEDDLDTLLARPSGSGPRLCSLFVATGAGAAMTSGFSRMTSGAITWTSDINGDGYAIYDLTDATWSGLVYVTAHTQDTIPQTFVVTADLHDTITVTAHVINTPTDTGKVNLYLYTDQILGDTLEGAIMTISPIKRGKNWKTDGGRILILGDASATADSNGLVQIEVYQSSFVHPYKWSRSLGAYTTGSDSLEYKITVSYGELAPFVINFFVAPDSGDTYQIGGE